MAAWRTVTAEKIERYGRLAAYFLEEHGLRNVPVRYHVVAVVFDPDGRHELEFIENASSRKRSPQSHKEEE